MRSSQDGSTPVVPVPTPPNAFDPLFLSRLAERDEPATGPEADVAGPWVLEEIAGAGHAVFRRGEGSARHFRPTAVFRTRAHALLAAAVLPGTGRAAAFRMGLEAADGGYPLHDPSGALAGHLRHFDQTLNDALHVVETLIRSPEALANLLEAAGGLALERAGAILDERVPPPVA